MIISSLFLLTGSNLFRQNNSLTAQPQRGPSLSKELEAYSLPVGAITENDIPRIKNVIEQVLNKISESMKSAGQAGNRSDYRPIKSGILIFQDWLNQQECINQASASYDVEATDEYSEHIFMTYPGQLPFDIFFDMEGEVKKQYRLLIFVSTIDLFDFASLIENKTLSGVPVPKNWPNIQ
jgi:hypothetical protein